MNLSVFLSIKEVAQRLRVSVATAYQLCGEGKLPHHRFGRGRGTIRVREEDLAAFIADCKVQQPTMNAAGLKHIKAASSKQP